MGIALGAMRVELSHVFERNQRRTTSLLAGTGGETLRGTNLRGVNGKQWQYRPNQFQIRMINYESLLRPVWYSLRNFNFQRLKYGGS